MILILITLVFVFQKTQISAKSDFEILKNDSIFDGGTQGNKAFLKTQLLRNLNNFYPSINNGEKLEMLTGRKPEFEDDRERNQNFDGNSVSFFFFFNFLKVLIHMLNCLHTLKITPNFFFS